MLVRLAKFSFGARVIAIARRLEQIDRAMMLGANEGVLMGERAAIAAEVGERTGGRGADVVIEAIGKPEIWELALQLARKGGVVNFFGGCPAGTKVGLDTSLLHYSEITCKATFHHTPAHIRRALELVARGEAGARHFVNAEEPLDALPRVLRELANARNDRIKTAIIP
ncbi:MAG: zinc-binding dehydrogenase, partial [Bryobacteraceae bacterium]